LKTADFDYDLPAELIAQQPTAERDQSRLLVLDRRDGSVQHHRFIDLPGFLKAGDLVVFNDSRVIRARLRGIRPASGGRFEILLLSENQVNDWWVMMKPGKRVKPGSPLTFLDLSGQIDAVEAVVEEKNDEGHCRLRFLGTKDLRNDLDRIGEVPLPPYIERAAGIQNLEDATRYQTVYAQHAGSVAAPTAGLHFTTRMMDSLKQRGVEMAFVTLHVGPGTFAPVKEEDLSRHPMHEESFEISASSAGQILKARAEKRRVIAVGTTSMRVLESSAAQNGGCVAAMRGSTRLFIHPPYDFKVVDVLLTNFHLPKSTLLMLVCAFASPGSLEGCARVLNAYQEAIKNRYRFFSYGDAMLVI
jgi:S-adenosylmethionine:tRNA ribosyltransferase-isomerase